LFPRFSADGIISEIGPVSQAVFCPEHVELIVAVGDRSGGVANAQKPTNGIQQIRRGEAALVGMRQDEAIGVRE